MHASILSSLAVLAFAASASAATVPYGYPPPPPPSASAAAVPYGYPPPPPPHPSTSAAAVPYGYQAPPPPLPTASCSNKSRSLTHWTAADISYGSSIIFTNPAHQVDSATIKFRLVNPALGYKADCHATSSQLSDFFYGNLIYKCAVPGNDWASFSFNRPANELQVNQSWACSEDGSHYNAQGRAKLNLDCNEKKWQNANWTTPSNGFYSTDIVSCKNLTASVQIEQIIAIA